jgi:hypothetical protein
MTSGIQFTDSLNPNQSIRFSTHSWNPSLHVIWYVQPVTVKNGAPEIEWEVSVERAAIDKVTYYITVRNLTNSKITVEGRYTILNG